jgi:hypothetical protein
LITEGNAGNELVKLAFETDVQFGGISRKSVQVIGLSFPFCIE